MNKLLKAFLLFSGILLAIYCVGKFTGTLVMFKVRSTASYPTLKEGQYFWASNLIRAKRFDLVCYNAVQPPYGRGIFVSRICGMEGDWVEIKNGTLYINKRNADHNLPLALPYHIPYADYLSLQESKEIEHREPWEYEEITEDTIATYVDVRRLRNRLIHWQRVILPREQMNDEINMKFQKKWNQDHFGPIQVPPEHCFVLGDNRLYAMDSRYTGFIHKKDIVAVAIGNN